MDDRQSNSPVLAAIDGWPINLANLKTAVEEVTAAAAERQPFAAFTLNLDHLVKLRREGKFRRAYERARFVTADGTPVAFLARLQFSKVQRTTGADLVVPLAQAAADASIPIFLFGSSADVLARAGRDLAERTDFRLDIAGSCAPPQGFDPEGAEAAAVLERIKSSGAGLCFIALGAPKQEIFAARAVELGVPCGFVCIGAALDFLAGAQKRAPKAMQNYGLEWLWRLTTNPARLAGRYARCALMFADLVVLAPLKGIILPHRT